MALNLWKLGGKPTSYNPLPSGLVTNKIPLGIGEYIITIKAKSATSRMIKVWVDLESSDNFRTQLYPYTTTVTYTKKVTQPNMYLYIADYLTTENDIIIEDIQLVQKPLPKLTINGISGDVADWVQGTAYGVNTARITTANYIDYILPNQSHTISFSTNYQVVIVQYDSSNIVLNDSGWQGSGVGKYTFTTLNNTKRLKVTFSKVSGTDLTPSEITNIQPMLNLGTTPAPYSKKTGERMVMPTVKSVNLLSKEIDQNYSTAKIKPNSSYVFKMDNVINATTWRFAVKFFLNGIEVTSSINTNLLSNPNGFYYNATYGMLMNGDAPSKTFSFGGINADEVRIGLAIGDVVSATKSVNAQLEEGTKSTSYTPYAVQLNKKPQRLVAKKNLFDGALELGLIIGATGQNSVSSNNIRSVNYIPIKPNVQHNLTDYVNGVVSNGISDITFYDINKNFISTTTRVLFNSNPVPSNAYFIRFRSTTGFIDLSVQVMLVEGTTATPYEPYTLVLPKAKTGLSFEGQNSYFQLPSMTMDAIEIECLIDSPSSNYLVDARNGLLGGYAYAGAGGLGSGWKSLQVDGVETAITSVPRGQRKKFKLTANTPFTDDVNILSSNLGTFALKAILYKVTCYLNGSIVAQYDFENPRNIVGNQVIPNAQNLIPSFEDSRWNIHVNAKVFGKDVLHLDATGASQASWIALPVISGKQYRLDCNMLNGGLLRIVKGNVFDAGLPSILLAPGNFTVDDSYGGYVSLRLTSANAGSFDFIKPQLYQLTGNEGTLFGGPQRLNKPSKRTLYNRR